MATDNDSFETAGQRLLKARAWDMLPKAAQHALALGWNRHHEARRERQARAFIDLIRAFGDAEGEQQVQERIEWLMDDEDRVDELLKHINTLTFEVHLNARKAYLALAADSMSQTISYDLARDLGQLLRQLSGREIPMLARLIASAHANDQQVNESFARGISAEGKSVATRLIGRLVNAGLATQLRPPPKQLNPGTPAWGCKLNDAEMGLDPLVRYAKLLEGAE